ncbi:MAG: hypothetical protein IIZ92_23295 [Aquincola sp.]|nr:hypothetical protein [Aquincola sp.]
MLLLILEAFILICFKNVIVDDFRRFSAFLVKDDRRLPLPVGRVQHFKLEPFTHWAGQTSDEVTPEMRKLFQMGPPV